MTSTGLSKYAATPTVRLSAAFRSPRTTYLKHGHTQVASRWLENANFVVANDLSLLMAKQFSRLYYTSTVLTIRSDLASVQIEKRIRKLAKAKEASELQR